ncbi:putative quinol monooxygenase [Loktanella sp. Alg231-35]|uniref:putative quinol monooxygenase n=1 Tax=Loktanella sp. Alg231-35 TaxID=1922220 RepID=UPI000D56054D|nr:antibiotic biosynthesis monooxygenase family protein [Loktanella sp. Alg231-35]
MIYVEVNFTVAAVDQGAAVACLLEEALVMQALPGNQGYRVLVQPQTEGVITLLHKWNDLDSLDAYRNGPLFAKVGGVLRPIMTGAPSTTVYDATPVG